MTIRSSRPLAALLARAVRTASRLVFPLALVAALGVAATASAAVAVDATSSAIVKDSIITWSHTVGVGSNKLLLVGVSSVDGDSVTSITSGSASLSYVGMIAGSGKLVIYRLVGPATGTNAITVNLNKNTDNVAGAISFTGVDQAAPLGAPLFTSDFGTAISANVASRTGDLVFDVVSSQMSNAPTVGAGQTSRWGRTQGGAYGMASTEAGASSVTMSWTTAFADWEHGAINVRAANPDPGQLVTGSYAGNATDNTAIIREVGFEPDVVFVSGETAPDSVVHTATMNGDLTKPLTAAASLTAGLIKSLDATAGVPNSHGGFTVGTDARVNGNLGTYDFVALTARAGEVFIGSYVGTGSTLGVTGVGFQPDMVMIFASLNVAAVFRTSSMASNVVVPFGNGASVGSCINTLNATGFTVTTDTRCNGANTIYHYVAWKATASKLVVGSYPGSLGADDRTIALAGFGTPDWVIVNTATAGDAVHKMAVTGQDTDTACYFGNVACAADTIQKLQTDGFQVGKLLNVNGAVYYYIAFSHRATATAVTLASFTATRRPDAGTVLQWRTGYEVDNLGFNLYREQNGIRLRLTPSLVRGSGWLTSAVERSRASSYQWIDRTPAGSTGDVTYWLEDVDLNGKRTLHGPIAPVAGQGDAGTQSSLLLPWLGTSQPGTASAGE